MLAPLHTSSSYPLLLLLPLRLVLLVYYSFLCSPLLLLLLLLLLLPFPLHPPSSSLPFLLHRLCLINLPLRARAPFHGRSSEACQRAGNGKSSAVGFSSFLSQDPPVLSRREGWEIAQSAKLHGLACDFASRVFPGYQSQSYGVQRGNSKKQASRIICDWWVDLPVHLPSVPSLDPKGVDLKAPTNVSASILPSVLP